VVCIGYSQGYREAAVTAATPNDKTKHARKPTPIGRNAVRINHHGCWWSDSTETDARADSADGGVRRLTGDANGDLCRTGGSDVSAETIRLLRGEAKSARGRNLASEGHLEPNNCRSQVWEFSKVFVKSA